MPVYRTQVPINPWIWFKSLVFFITYNLMGIGHSLLCVTIGLFLPFETRYRFINLWTHGAMALLRALNGVQIEIRGRENIPADGRFVVIANHQSSWETFQMQTIFSPQATVLKRELLWLPFFGWALALMKPIRIDRSKASNALKQIMRQGKKKLEQGIPVVIYPEGTRQPPGHIGTFNVGGAMLACQAKVPVLPVVHNSGDCWPARSLLRVRGKIILEIGPAISCEGKKPRQVNEETRAWIEEHFRRISEEVGHHT
jgi:1-acyl-sn-glycerol-3-phosphate acyltransferase